jgi:alkanesulfonate monooxygenase SsuD/methylene tetrahydromethanopterin reductase-like flavin-dependent oxidoreductase (luciferase family)
MDVGIGLPSTIPEVEREQVLEWARRAEDAGFSTLGVLDRLVYPNYEPLITLTAAALVTERIRLTTAVINLPWRENAALVAKQAATLHLISGGRLVFGAALGAREDDYEVSGSNLQDRAERFERMLEQIERIWQGEEDVGPPLESPPPILVGGGVEASFKRVARYGAGWMMGANTPETLAEGKKKVEAAWKEAGRDGKPRIGALAYYALGENAEEAAEKDLKHYYAWLGDEIAEMIAGAAATDAETVKGYNQAFEQAGCDELIWFPTDPDPEQVNLLAEAALK